MRTMLRPEAFITPRQPLSPPAQLHEPMNASFWDANIDPNLPPLNPAVSEIELTKAEHDVNPHSDVQQRYSLFCLALKQC